jgi:Carbohydrate esterase, sialic acid-specific acetylesterase
MIRATLLLAVLGFISTNAGIAAPLKVFLMAGQSNMQGYCSVATFPQVEADPNTAPLHKKMAHPDGKPRVHESIWISTSGCAKDDKPGQLTTGYGGGKGGDRIGPELTFGITMQEHLKQPMLIIKTAWGGKSLCRDFRPPSAGVHPAHTRELDELKKQNQDTAELEKEYAEAHGKYYRMMIGHARSVLGDIKKVYPAYDAAQGYELAGFVWFQGENDFGDQTTYPNPGEPGGFDEYTRLLTCLIRDVRSDLKAPQMNAVIGVLGFNGELETERYRQIEPLHIPWLREFRKAMAAPAEMPEFKGRVAAVHTEKFWEPELEELQGRWKRVKAKNGELKAQGLSKEAQKSAIDEFLKTVYTPGEWHLMETGVSHACYHYLGSAKIMAQIGKAFADAMNDLNALSTNRPN